MVRFQTPVNIILLSNSKCFCEPEMETPLPKHPLPWDSRGKHALIAFYSRGGLEAHCHDKGGVSEI